MPASNLKLERNIDELDRAYLYTLHEASILGSYVVQYRLNAFTGREYKLRRTCLFSIYLMEIETNL